MLCQKLTLVGAGDWLFAFNERFRDLIPTAIHIFDVARLLTPGCPRPAAPKRSEQARA
jgi:hypothetical protein